MEDKLINILIVDDEPIIRGSLEDLLSDMVPFAQFTQAGNGLEALACLEKECFDLLITDLHMPKLTGQELIESLKKLPSNHHPHSLIVISGHLTSSSTSEASKNSKVLYQAKPPNTQEIKAFIKNRFFNNSPGNDTSPLEKENEILEALGETIRNIESRNSK